MITARFVAIGSLYGYTVLDPQIPVLYFCGKGLHGDGRVGKRREKRRGWSERHGVKREKRRGERGRKGRYGKRRG